MKFIKPVAENITSPIANIINSSIDKEIFPDSWKVARVCPVPKIDNPIFPTHFNITSIIKSLRKVILKQLSNYIERTSIYNSTESGFRKGHATQTILLKFRDGIQCQYSLTVLKALIQSNMRDS